jgi:hypothetical protein
MLLECSLSFSEVTAIIIAEIMCVCVCVCMYTNSLKTDIQICTERGILIPRRQ